MSVTFGFYNSKEGDRRYDAIQMSSIFDGIIQDGILQHVGTAMVVKESEAMIINVGVGRAWFNHTWTLNDALLPLVVPQSEILLNRYDAVVLEVDSREAVRANDIKIIKGTPASNPTKPTMVKTNDRWQYPLAYIYVGAGVTSIRQANITNCVGTSECPFVTAPLDKVEIDDLIAQWQDQWTEFYDCLLYTSCCRILCWRKRHGRVRKTARTIRRSHESIWRCSSWTGSRCNRQFCNGR